LRAARQELRDRLFAPLVESVAKALAARRAKRFHPNPAINIVGIGLGEKVTAGQRTGERCVKVLVAQKFPLGEIGRGHRIPAHIAGLPTDIEAVGYPKRLALPQQRRWRPIMAGVSISLGQNAVPYKFAGTLGVVMVDRNDPQRLFALSNNHVLANENRIKEGATVIQPGSFDGGRSRDRIGRLTRFIPLKFNNRPNRMDAALAEFDDPSLVNRTIVGIGLPTGVANPSLNLLIRKSGRTTGLTEGIIRVVNFDAANVEYEQGLVRVDDVVVIEGVGGAFSRLGDSGSAVVDSRGRVVALLFAGSAKVTFAIPIRRILNRFQVRLTA
jgi:S1-C subfamily serine protease